MPTYRAGDSWGHHGWGWPQEAFLENLMVAKWSLFQETHALPHHPSPALSSTQPLQALLCLGNQHPDSSVLQHGAWQHAPTMATDLKRASPCPDPSARCSFPEIVAGWKEPEFSVHLQGPHDPVRRLIWLPHFPLAAMLVKRERRKQKASKHCFVGL